MKHISSSQSTALTARLPLSFSVTFLTQLDLTRHPGRPRGVQECFPDARGDEPVSPIFLSSLPRMRLAIVKVSPSKSCSSLTR